MGVPDRTAEAPGGAVRLRIDALAAGGRGVGRHRGRVWFVEDAFPGDEVLARPVRERSRFVEARTARLLAAGPDRRPSPCPHQGRCGGCPWMPWPEAGQRAWKRRILGDALARLGGLDRAGIEPMRAPTPALGYRNRVEFTVTAAGGPTIGLLGRGSRETVPIDRCLLQDDRCNGILETIRASLASLPPALLDALPGDARWRLTIRRSERHDDRIVAVREERRPFPELARLAERWLAAGDGLSGVVRRTGGAGRRGGGSWQTVAGRGSLDETLAGMRFRLAPGTFTQVHAAAAETLAELVCELAGEVEGLRVHDLYGGVGLYGLVLRREGAAGVTVVDAAADAIRCGAEAARRAGLDAVEHVRCDVGTWLTRRPARPDLVVANPPRGGMADAVSDRLARCGCPLIVVSCDPATLARDLGRLAANGRFRVTRVVPVDLFPQTPHLETVVRLDPAAPPAG